METLQITLYANPFPLMVVENFYNEEELSLIWEELNFYTRPEKLLDAEGYGCLLYTSPSPRDATLSRMPSSA